VTDEIKQTAAECLGNRTFGSPELKEKGEMVMKGKRGGREGEWE
jgi:hypothetical protein